MTVTQPNDVKRSDGKAVVIESTSPFDKGHLVRKGFGITSDWYGFACQDAASGDNVAITIAAYEFELIVPSTVTGDFGDILYFVAATGVITGAAGATNVPFMKVTLEKDSNDVVWGILLPQIMEWA